MSPAPGERLATFVGDRLEFRLQVPGGLAECRACLRTTLGSGDVQNDEIVRAFEHSTPFAHLACRDLPMQRTGDGFRLSLLLAETGYFWAKAFLIDGDGFQHWPAGDNFCVSVHPGEYRTANLVYCAWPRLFGDTAREPALLAGDEPKQVGELEGRGYAVIPPSGTLRDLQGALEHIVGTLGCRIIHLLPVNPTPTVKARYGRFGSPYASLDLRAVDPALVEFDRRTTGLEQFCELTRKAHCLGARVFLDLVINHTGWGSGLQENHPEWFRRHRDGRFASPGAWGTVWEDLVELDHHDPELGKELADVFLTWCRRGVDGFRCDAGYMVPRSYWQYITARVRREFPDTIFLLEGLGGSWAATEGLLNEGGMQWAYSELFQNYSGEQVRAYLDYAHRASRRFGLYLHYSETHDNPRLASGGAAWSLLRNRLCGLASTCGGFGFTCGVEWLAKEKIVVHQRTGLNWGSRENLVEELACLNRLLATHPCFFDGASLDCLSGSASAVYALERISAEGRDRVLVLINTDAEAEAELELPEARWVDGAVDLLRQPAPEAERIGGGMVRVSLPPAAACCLSASPEPAGLSGEDYRQRQRWKAWMAEAIRLAWPEGLQAEFDLEEAAEGVARDPVSFLSALSACRSGTRENPWQGGDAFPGVVEWEPEERPRHLPVPPGHWVLFRDSDPFVVRIGEGEHALHRFSTRFGPVEHLAFLHADGKRQGMVPFDFQSREGEGTRRKGRIDFLSAWPEFPESFDPNRIERSEGLESPVVLLTNGRGAMARMAVDFGRIKSKYDCLLAANFSRKAPEDRHVLVKRLRLWAQVDGLISALNRGNLVQVRCGPPAQWLFLVGGGSGRRALVEVAVDMIHERNTVVVRCRRPGIMRIPEEVLLRRFGAMRHGSPSTTPGECRLSLTARIDIEDRNFHWETCRNPELEAHFTGQVADLEGREGFLFDPGGNRRLIVCGERCTYHPAPEWSCGIPHPLEASRGQNGWGDAYSPGWFEVPLEGEDFHLVLSAESGRPSFSRSSKCFRQREQRTEALMEQAGLPADDGFGCRLLRAADDFVVRRGEGKTVVAGYPWFLDWGRDSLIAARGLLSCGYRREVIDLLKVFGRFERGGTLPNSLHGQDTSNRDTSDAPLWFGTLCADLVESKGPGFLETRAGDRSLGEVLRSIALGYLSGTPNGIRVDAESGLVWSPSHFTWMDTDHPPGTPREGYPVEIQALWIHLLRLLDRAGIPPGKEKWGLLADRATASVEERFWLEDEGYYADCIRAAPGREAGQGTVDPALRSNYLLYIAGNLAEGKRARRAVGAALRWLLVPGAVRSLAPLPADLPLPIRDGAGRLLNDPGHPFWGRYEGDEDTRRKPAYHNGTAWTWPLGTLCEAVLRAWEFSPDAKAAVRSWLSATGQLMQTGCLGQIPEILDGEAPHTQRGCDAQAWGVTEAMRVWRMVS